MSSLHYVLNCALFDTRMFACATEAANMPYKKIISCDVDTNVKVLRKFFSIVSFLNDLKFYDGERNKLSSHHLVVLVIPVVQDLLAEIKMYCFFHSLTGCKKHALSFQL